jgi:hypothetical protein
MNSTDVPICSVTVRDETSGQEQSTRLSTPLEPQSVANVKIPYLGGDLNDPPAQVRKRVEENRSKAVWSVEAHGCTDSDLDGPFTGSAVERSVVARVTGIRGDLDALETAPVVLN